MATFFMFGKYSAEAIREISAARTDQAVKEIKKLGGEVSAMHALLGENDLLFCVGLPDTETALQASVRLSKLTGIAFKTMPGVPIATFDQLTGKQQGTF